MQVLLDDQVLGTDYDDIPRAIEVARDEAARQGRVIVAILLDGQSVREEDFESLCAGEIETMPGEMRLQSADPLELIRGVLEQADGALQEAVRLQAEAGELLQSGDADAAMSKLTAPMELWGQIYQAVVQCGMLLSIDFAEIDVDGEPADRIITGLADQLRQVRDALVSQDQVALADELCYEMADTADRWEGLIRTLSERIAAGESDG